MSDSSNLGACQTVEAAGRCPGPAWASWASPACVVVRGEGFCWACPGRPDSRPQSTMTLAEVGQPPASPS